MCFFRLQKKFVTQRLYGLNTAGHTKEQQEYFLLLFYYQLILPIFYYSMMLDTTPEPTVRPPSRRQWIIILVFPFDNYAFLRCFLDVFIFYNSILQNN